MKLYTTIQQREERPQLDNKVLLLTLVLFVKTVKLENLAPSTSYGILNNCVNYLRR